jgi:hypothetical protein
MVMVEARIITTTIFIIKEEIKEDTHRDNKLALHINKETSLKSTQMECSILLKARVTILSLMTPR